MKILNLFAGIGGNRTLWDDKHEITAVEHNQQIAMIYLKRFPNDTVIVGDAYQYLEKHYKEYDFIWASPPCTTHTQLCRWHPTKRLPDLRLYGIIILLRAFFPGPWCVENVFPYYKPLVRPTVILGRHYFWTSHPIRRREFKGNEVIVGFKLRNQKKSTIKDRRDVYKIKQVDPKLLEDFNPKNWPSNDPKQQLINNCLNPEIGKYILDSIKVKTTLENFL
jgi:DNA (cytosine-5)-methyltransferase 1